MHIRSAIRTLAVPSLLLTLVACGGEEAPPPAPAAKPAAKANAPAPPAATTPAMPAASPAAVAGEMTASAEITPLGTAKLAGSVTFTESGGKVTVTGHLTGLTPGKHGFHVHEFGDCSGDGTPAGGHFNPATTQHGAMDGAHHSGDLGNITADDKGEATLAASTSQFTLASGANNILGRSVVIHDKEDDLTTQPSGNSGARIGCGVIRSPSGTTAPVTKP